MRLPIALTVALCLVCLSEPVTAQDQTWQTVSIPGICTFQIPASVEIQKGTYKQINDKFRGIFLEIETSPDRVVAQPKGINSFDPQARKLYCRIIVETDRGSRGDYSSIDDPLAVSQPELDEVDEILKQEIQNAAALYTSKGMKMTITSWEPVKIVRVNGVDALRTTYTRRINDSPPVIVNMFMIPNNDCMHKITVSYRLAEKDRWATDLSKVPDTFKFVKR